VATSMKGTLSMGRKDAPRQALPVFDPEENTAELHTPEGIRLLQLDHLFNKSHQYIGSAPAGTALAPLTPEQKRNLKVQREKNLRFFGGSKAVIREAGLPQKVIDAERENARARAAEFQAA
jgi:hypothetical protein